MFKYFSCKKLTAAKFSALLGHPGNLGLVEVLLFVWLWKVHSVTWLSNVAVCMEGMLTRGRL